MKHVLALLCMTFMSILTMDEASASLLFDENQTPPLELNSDFVSEKGYQVAKVTWLPDYLGKNKSYSKDRVNNDGKDVDSRDCARYGLAASCSDGTGTIVHPIAGLTCYENCKKSCLSSGFVDSCPSPQTGTAVTTEDGLTCYKDCKCPITYRYTTSTTLTAKMLGRTAFVNHCASPALVGGESCSQTYVNTTTSQTETAVLYKECNCPSQYNSNLQADGDCTPCTNGNGVTQYACVANCRNYPLIVCPSGGICTPCPVDGSKYKLDGCESGYSLNNGQCVKDENCDAYTLNSCPDGCNCTPCPDNGSLFKISSAKTDKGWSWTSGQTTCPATACPAGYTAGTTSCTSGSTKPDLTLNGWSGGLQCGMCSCKNVNNNCTAANYPLTTVPANASHEMCSTGCGSEKVTRYKITSCDSSYKLVNGVCKSDACPSGSPNISCSSSQRKVEVSPTDAGTKCYMCEDGEEDENGIYQRCLGKDGNLYNRWQYGVTECCMNVAETYGDDDEGRYYDSILYSDGSICDNIVRSKIPLAVVLSDDYNYAVGIDGYATLSGGLPWNSVQNDDGYVSVVKADNCSFVREIQDRNDSYDCENSSFVSIYAYGPRTTLCALKRGAGSEIDPEAPGGAANIFQVALGRTKAINREYLGCGNPELGKDILDRKGVWYIPSATELGSLYQPTTLKYLNCRIRLMQKVSENAGNTTEFIYGKEDIFWLPYASMSGHPCIYVSYRGGEDYSVPDTAGNQTYIVYRGSSKAYPITLFVDPLWYSEIAKDPNRCKTK